MYVRASVTTSKEVFHVRNSSWWQLV